MIKKLLVSALMIYSFDALAFANSEVKVHGMTTRINVPSAPSHVFEYGIQNNTSLPQTYTITYTLCARDQLCATNTMKIGLNSTQRVQQKVYLPYSIVYRSPGQYWIKATLQIQGESSHVSTQTAYITVLRG